MQSVPITTTFVSSNTAQASSASTKKTDRHDKTEILLKVALNTINPLHYGPYVRRDISVKNNIYL